MSISVIINPIIDNDKTDNFTPHDLKRAFEPTLLDVGADKIAVSV